MNSPILGPLSSQEQTESQIMTKDSSDVPGGNHAVEESIVVLDNNLGAEESIVVLDNNLAAEESIVVLDHNPLADLAEVEGLKGNDLYTVLASRPYSLLTTEQATRERDTWSRVTQLLKSGVVDEELLIKLLKELAAELDGTVGNTFLLFNCLPTELRLQIWSYAEPEPAMVYQHNTESHGILYLRKVPAILHACSESRREYLELETDTAAMKLGRRQANHAIYKPSFRVRSRRAAAAHFCVDIDTLWATEHSFRKNQFGLLVTLDVTKTIQHLAFSSSVVYYSLTFIELLKTFPQLKTLTLIIEMRMLVYRHCASNRRQCIAELQQLPLIPEQQGNLVHNGLPEVLASKVSQEIARVIAHSNSAQALQPNLRFPQLKFRFESQVQENEAFVIPPPRPHVDEEFTDPKDLTEVQRQKRKYEEMTEDMQLFQHEQKDSTYRRGHRAPRAPPRRPRM